MNIVQLIRAEAAAYPEKTAVIQGNAQITYSQLLSRVDQLALDLRRHGVQPLDRVALIADDSIDYILVSLAILSLSAVTVPISPSLTRAEAERILAQMMIHFTISEHPFPELTATSPLTGGPFTGMPFQISARRDAPQPSAEYAAMNPAFIRFSSGTTGASKGILLSHQSILDRTEAANRGLQMTSRDVVLWVLSMSFHFVVTILLFLRKGCTIVLCNADFPLSLVDGLARHGGTFIYASPFHYHALVSSAAIPSGALSRVRMAVSTAMHLPRDLAAAFQARFGFLLSSAYGIIEVGLPFINAAPDPSHSVSVGRSLPDYDIRIANAGPDGIGDIMIRGKGLFDAYVSPWRSRAECLHDGWFRTGDLGKLDADGYLTIAGRDNAVINFAGMKIFPQEVEEVLNQHPSVLESMVYGVPHPQYGQLPVAKIILEPEAAAAFDSTQLRRFCFERLAPFKVPKEFHFVDNLERTASNKLRRFPAASPVTNVP
jgi:long-chain acyl-CoA synthetase